ncbi:MAG: transcriptional regulator with XRE-family HTH domain, partial [Arcticibacterium sp.]
MSLGKYVSNWRTENSKIMLELSTLSRIDQALISKYESGKNPVR